MAVFYCQKNPLRGTASALSEFSAQAGGPVLLSLSVPEQIPLILSLWEAQQPWGRGRNFLYGFLSSYSSCFSSVSLLVQDIFITEIPRPSTPAKKDVLGEMVGAYNPSALDAMAGEQEARG